MPGRPPTPAFDPERLLAEDRFVRGLARHLRRGDGEDLAQQTFLAALERPPAPTVSLRAWLAAVLRRIAGRRDRSDARERHRQEVSARPAQVPSTAEIVAREAMRAAVVRAVLALDEPYRAVVVLRYFESLAPRAIARRLDLPVETVRTRLKRAMATLRARLDRETDGGRAAWSALLLPFTKAPNASLLAAAGGAHALWTGVLLMTTKAKLTTCAALVGGLVLLTAWVLGPSFLGVPPADDGTAVARPEVAPGTGPGSAPAAAPASAPDSLVRESVAASTAPATGELRVHVIWGEDKTAAAGIDVRLLREDGDEPFDSVATRTDVEGIARFLGVPPGRLYAEVRRGQNEFSKWLTITAGALAETTVEISQGMHVRGLVVDGDGKPVAGAEVLVSDWAGGEAVPLARTGADGTFALRSVATHCHIGARAPGFAPSSLRQFTAGKGAAVELRIVLDRPAAELSGTVLDPLGQPVADAVVQAGNEDQRNHQLPDGARAMGPRPARTRTDAAGRFALPNLEAGTTPVLVRARGLSVWRKTLELKPGPNPQWIQLEPGVTLCGTVRDSAGQPVAKAQIGVSTGDHLSRRSLHTAADGAFRIEGLPAGALQVNVESQSHGKTTTTLLGTAGETLYWNPVLAPGLNQRGVVLDVEGKPVPRAMVEATLEWREGGPHWFAFENTNAEGRFTLKNCPPGQRLRVTVRRKSTFSEVVLRELTPSAEELMVRLPREAWIYIQGKVLDPDGKPLPNVAVSPSMKGGSGSPAESVDPGTGAFRYGPYPPGEYQIHFSAAGYPRIVVPWRKVAPDEVWDLGTLQFQRGASVVVQLREPGGVNPVHHSLTIFDAAGRRVEQFEVKDGAGRAGPLAPGDYILQLAGEDLACSLHPFSVRSGADTRLDIEGRSGVRTPIEFTLPAGTAPDQSVDVVIRTVAASLVFRGNAWGGQGPIRMTPCLLPGDYQLEASLAALRGEARLTVGSTPPATTMVRLAPR